MPESLVQGGASSARDDEKLCSSHSSTALAHYLRDWANTCQKEDNAVLYTWNYSENPNGCEFCSFMKSEVDRVNAYKEQIFNLKSASKPWASSRDQADCFPDGSSEAIRDSKTPFNRQSSTKSYKKTSLPSMKRLAMSRKNFIMTRAGV